MTSSPVHRGTRRHGSTAPHRPWWNRVCGGWPPSAWIVGCIIVACALCLTGAAATAAAAAATTMSSLQTKAAQHVVQDTAAARWQRTWWSTSMPGRRHGTWQATMPHHTGAASPPPETRIPGLVGPNLTSAFPDLALWLAGPDGLRRGLCEAMHPGLKRAALPIPSSGHTVAEGNASNTSSPALASSPFKDIPVVVLSHDNPSYLHAMVRFLRCYGVASIIVYDTASSLPLHLELLDALERVVTVRRLPTNDGPRSFLSAANLAGLPRFFALTDADLRPHPDLAPNFLAYLAALTQAFPGHKAGFALDLAMRDQFLRGTYHGGMPISRWEDQFWGKRLPRPPGGSPDALYAADIDTTFAVYDKRAYPPDAAGSIAWPYEGVRVAGTFAATHVPWLCYATAQYMTAAEWDFVRTRPNGWSTTGKLAAVTADKLGDGCAGTRR